jgi:peptide/nickel transport system permease protein
MERDVQSRWIWHHPLSAIGGAAAVLLLCACLAAPWVAPYDPAEIDLSVGLQSPSADHVLGTDQLGRDVLSRLLWGGRASITVAAAVLLVSLTVGLSVGVVAGYSGGVLDQLGVLLMDFIYALPSTILALALIGALGPRMSVLILALAVSGWIRYGRLARSMVLSLRESEFVLAARSLGASDWRIMYRHLLPSLVGPVAVQLSLDTGVTVLAIAGLSFLGLGIQPPTPEWGTMLVDARPYMDYAAHMVFPPGVAVFVLVLGCNMLSQGLEEWLRPD